MAADFGFAQHLSTCTAQLETKRGTEGYRAPEVVQGKPHGMKSDVFSMGVVMYRLLGGLFPFTCRWARTLPTSDDAQVLRYSWSPRV